MKKLQYFIPILLFVIFSISCKKETNAYIDANAPAPLQVSNLKVEATPGGAIITYKIPVDKNLLYVKAVYEIQPGIFREAKTIFYKDTLALVGFGDTLSHKVSIYTIGKNEKESRVIPIYVKPLMPPVKSVMKTINMDATFGGVVVDFKNIHQADLSIVILMDTTGHNSWAPVTTYYTAALAGKFATHGLDSIERRFAVFIRDRWNNKSDTLIKSLKPLYEMLIPWKPFVAYHLLGDFWEGENAAHKLENAFDGIVNVSEDVFATKNFATRPQWWTLDLHQNVVFSRMKLYQRSSYPYSGVYVKSFEIWGSNAPAADGSWESWQLLGDFNSIKPSGLPGLAYTANDMVFVKAGEEFIFPQPIPAVRYLRFKFKDSYGGTGQYHVGELTFWGQLVP